MSAQEYIELVTKQVAELHDARLTTQDRHYSDLVDADGRQYIDVVMEGGGVLGIALLGYLYILEQAGLRFLSLGGASAGSVTALVVAALGAPPALKMTRAVEILADVPIETFVDGDSDARDFTDAMLRGDGWLPTVWTGAQVIDNLRDELGLHPGEAFRTWLRSVLDREGIDTLAKLRARMATPPAGGYRKHGTEEPITLDPSRDQLCLIASDVSTETRVELPRMAPLYWADPASVHPAELARASMSVPLFFRPYVIDNPPRGDGQKALWRDLAGFDEQSLRDKIYPGDWLPNHLVLVDGGVLSNFPIDAFHAHNSVPLRPTFGVKLQWDDRSHHVSKLTTFLGQLANTARHTLDYQFLIRNPDFRNLVAFIDTRDQNWLDFGLSTEARKTLFKRGAETAVEFLGGFDWVGYRSVRAEMVVGVLHSDRIRETFRERRASRRDRP